MHRWMAAFPNPTNPDKEDNEVIYEDWGENYSGAGRYSFGALVSNAFIVAPDCPQVQCVEQYIGQQTDELTLEPTEIVNVIRKTNEGKNVKMKMSSRLRISHLCDVITQLIDALF